MITKKQYYNKLKLLHKLSSIYGKFTELNNILADIVKESIIAFIGGILSVGAITLLIIFLPVIFIYLIFYWIFVKSFGAWKKYTFGKKRLKSSRKYIRILHNRFIKMNKKEQNK